MQEYTLIDLITPWFTLMMILLPLIAAERWIHQHLFGVVFLLTGDRLAATRMFYAIFMPGIFIHEVIQYLAAGIFNVPIKKVVAWPEEQPNGTLRFDFIVVEDEGVGPIRIALVSAAPFPIMGALVWFISTQVLNLQALTAALGSGELSTMGQGIAELRQTPDFFLWMFFLFVVANSMVPNRADMRGWPVMIGLAALLLFGLVVVGADETLLEAWGGPVNNTVNLVNTALGSVLFINVVVVLLLGITEDLIEKWTGKKMDYSGGRLHEKVAAMEKRLPGSDLPIPEGMPLPSIYNLTLPLPDNPAILAKKKAAAEKAKARKEQEKAVSRPDPVRPAFGAATEQRASSPSRFGHTEEKPALDEHPARPAGTGAFASRSPSGRSSMFSRTASNKKPDEKPAPDERPARPAGTGAFASRSPSGRSSMFSRTASDKKPEEKPAPDERPARPAGTGAFASRSPSGRSSMFSRTASDKKPDEKPAPDERPARPASTGAFASRSPSGRSSMFSRTASDKKPDEKPAPDERPVRPTGAFASRSPSGQRDFNAERSRIFGREKPDSEPDEKPARPSGFRTRETTTDAGSRQPPARPRGIGASPFGRSPIDANKEKEDSEIEYVDFDDDVDAIYDDEDF